MDHEEMLKETYRLSQENNRMLKAMRRSAFWGGVIRIIVYAALLIVPFWFYLTYMAPLVEDMMRTVNQIQGTGAQAQAQFSDLRGMWEQLQEALGAGQ